MAQTADNDRTDVRPVTATIRQQEHARAIIG